VLLKPLKHMPYEWIDYHGPEKNPAGDRHRISCPDDFDIPFHDGGVIWVNLSPQTERATLIRNAQ